MSLLLIHSYVWLARPLAVGYSLALGCVSSLAAQEPAVDEAKNVHEHASTATDGRTRLRMPVTNIWSTTRSSTARKNPPSRRRQPAGSPPPPQHPMESMDARQMVDLMEMDDAAAFAMLKFDRLERADTPKRSRCAIAWKVAAWTAAISTTSSCAAKANTRPADSSLPTRKCCWSHAVAPYWDTELGVRHDFGPSPNRNWAAFGMQGLAPYWFEVGATAYVGNATHGAAS